MQEIGLWEEVRSHAYPIYGLRLVAPSGREALLAGAESAHVLERSRFDEILVAAAISEGAVFLPETPVTAIRGTAGVVTGVVTPIGEISCRAVIAAGGATGRIGRVAGYEVLQTAMAWYEDLPFMPGIMEMIYDPALYPHYLWLFPESDRRVNIGFCLPASRRNRPITALFEDLLVRHFGDRLAVARRVRGPLGHPIQVSSRVAVTAPPGLLPVGEAAGLVNPATGEGISFAMASGRLAVSLLAEAWEDGRDNAWVSARYRAVLAHAFNRRFGWASFFCRHADTFIETAAWIGSSRLMRALTARAMSRL